MLQLWTPSNGVVGRYPSISLSREQTFTIITVTATSKNGHQSEIDALGNLSGQTRQKREKG